MALLKKVLLKGGGGGAKITVPPASSYDNVLGTIWDQVHGGYDNTLGKIWVTEPSGAWGGSYDNR